MAQDNDPIPNNGMNKISGLWMILGVLPSVWFGGERGEFAYAFGMVAVFFGYALNLVRRTSFIKLPAGWVGLVLDFFMVLILICLGWISFDIAFLMWRNHVRI